MQNNNKIDSSNDKSEKTEIKSNIKMKKADNKTISFNNNKNNKQKCLIKILIIIMKRRSCSTHTTFSFVAF